MKKLILFLLIISLFSSSAACGKQETKTEPEPAPEKQEDAEKLPEPSKPQEEPEPEPQVAEAVTVEAIPTQYGEHAVSDGEYIYFTVHSGDGDTWNVERDGLFRADLSMENVVKLARGNCHSLYLDGENLYFVLQDKSGLTSVCSIDKNGTEVRRIVKDVEGAESLGMQNGKLFFVQMGSFCIVEDTETGEVTRYSPERVGVTQALPAKNGDVWLYGVKNTDLSSMLYIYMDEDGRAWGTAGGGSRFTVCEESVYFMYPLIDQPAYEDFRQYEYVLMRMDEIGEPYQTGIVGRIAGDLFPYGPYLFYTKYTEVEEKAGEGEATVRKLFSYDTRTGEEKRVDRDAFIGIDLSIRDITGGRLFYNAYDYRSGAAEYLEFVGCYSCNLTGTDSSIDLKAITAEAEDAPSVSADDKAVDEYIEEREREREEELKNTPYGPGTSTLYLKAGSKSECYRLVKMDGSTEFMVLLAPGESVTKSFPCGKYVLKVARGETWISDDEAFGEDGYYTSTDVFNFESGAAYEISMGTQGSFHGDSRDGFTK